MRPVELTRFQRRLARWQRDVGVRTVVVSVTLFALSVSVIVCYSTFLLVHGSLRATDVILPIVVPLVIAPLASLLIVALLRTASRLIDELGESRRQLSLQVERAEAANARLGELSRRDPLTGVLNRRGFEDAVRELELGDATGAEPSTSIVVVVDIDRFKAVNDRYGHAMGDRALVETAQAMMSVSDEAIVARTGGDEFAGVYFGGGVEVETIRRRVRSIVISDEDDSVEIRCSVGSARHSVGDPFVGSLAAADRDLYRAKTADGSAG